MAILFAGSSEADVQGNARSGSGSAYKADTVREYFVVEWEEYARTDIFPATTDFWFTAHIRFAWYRNEPFLIFNDAAGNPRFRVRRSTNNSTSTYDVQAFDGSAWTTLLTTSNAYSYGVVFRIDLHIAMHETSGVVEFYIDKVQDGSFSGDTLLGSGNPVSQVEFRPVQASTSGDTYFSAIILADESTLQKHLVQMEFSGNGSYNDWGGGYTDVNGVGLSGSTSIVGVNANEVSTFTNTGIPSPYDTGYTVDAVVLGARGKVGSALDTIVAVRSGGADYEGPSFEFGELYTKAQAYLPTNPATGLPWGVSEVNSAELGVKLKNV